MEIDICYGQLIIMKNSSQLTTTIFPPIQNPESEGGVVAQQVDTAQFPMGLL